VAVFFKHARISQAQQKKLISKSIKTKQPRLVKREAAKENKTQ
jgi:hypothetical protein